MAEPDSQAPSIEAAMFILRFNVYLRGSPAVSFLYAVPNSG